MSDLTKKLIEIQAALKAPKGQHNSFGKYNYRSCEDILEAVKPLCKAQSLLLVIKDEIVCHGDRVYVKATAAISDDQNNILEVTAYAREAEDKKGMDDAQITGACSSYARKYALNGLFLIDDTKDADSQDNTVIELEVIDEKQLGQIKDYIDNFKEFNEEQFLKFNGVSAITDIPKKSFTKVMIQLETKKNQEAK